jgi:hypothetical protein
MSWSTSTHAATLPRSPSPRSTPPAPPPHAATLPASRRLTPPHALIAPAPAASPPHACPQLATPLSSPQPPLLRPRPLPHRSAEGCTRGFPHSGTSSPEATSVAAFAIIVAEGWKLCTRIHLTARQSGDVRGPLAEWLVLAETGMRSVSRLR